MIALHFGFLVFEKGTKCSSLYLTARSIFFGGVDGPADSFANFTKGIYSIENYQVFFYTSFLHTALAHSLSLVFVYSQPQC